MKAKRLLALLERQPLNYEVVRQSGSHRQMQSPGFPPLTFAFHDGVTIPGRLVRKILVNDVGLDEREARKLL
jgi:predicted RNA binding protein YcfA (HicA-like mRNA interferase family)